MIEVVRIALALVFAVAGAAKLFDRAGSRRALVEFGAPERLAAPLGLLLPLAELGIAVALLPTVSARYAAAFGAALLGVFTVAIGVALVRGRKPDCHCFGQLHSAPAGWGTLARNSALAGLAVLIATQPAAYPSLRTLGAVGGAVLVMGQAYLWFELLRRYGRALQRIDEFEAGFDEQQEVEIGSDAPEFALPTTEAEELTLSDLLAPEQPLLLVFTDPGCGACTALLPDLARWQAEYADRVTVAIVGQGDPERLRATAEEHGIELLLLARDRTVSEAYGAYGTPSAILVAADGRIASPLLYGAGEIEALLGHATELEGMEVVAHG